MNPDLPVDGDRQRAQAKDLCLRLLTDRARSRFELEDKLTAKGFRPEVITEVLDRLATAKLVDDAAFAEQWVQSRHEYGGKARRALAVELRRKGIAPETAAIALDGITADDERERAGELVRKKLRTMRSLPDSADRAEQDKVLRRLVGMLARRGYGQGTAFSVAKEELSRFTADCQNEVG